MLPPRPMTVPRRPVGVDRVTGVAQRWRPDYRGMRPDQCEAIDALVSHAHFGLFYDMRCGKTAITLRALPPKARSIVVCPASVMMVWEREQVPLWRPDLRVTCGEDLRKPHEGEILVFSWDNLPEPLPGSCRLTNESFRDVYLIGDEVQRSMNATAIRTQRWRMLSLQCGHVWGLSGTPMPGDPEQLWGVLVSLRLQNVFNLGLEGADGTVLGAHETFLHLCGGEPRWLYDKRLRRRVQRGWIWGAVSPEVRRIVETVSIRKLAKDVLDLPPKIYETIPCATPADLRDHLDDAAREAWDEIDPDELPPFERLSQGMAALARSKTEAAVAFAKDAAEAMPIIVFSAHVGPIEAFRDVKNASVVIGTDSAKQREKSITEWKSGKTRILAMTIQVGGMGLDLSRAGGILFVDRAYNPGDNDQAERRADKDGKKEPVMIWTMVCDHPMDQNVSRILTEKSRLREAIGV